MYKTHIDHIVRHLSKILPQYTLKWSEKYLPFDTSHNIGYVLLTYYVVRPIAQKLLTAVNIANSCAGERTRFHEDLLKSFLWSNKIIVCDGIMTHYFVLFSEKKNETKRIVSDVST